VTADFGEWMSGQYQPFVLAPNLSSRIHFNLAVPVFRVTPQKSGFRNVAFSAEIVAGQFPKILVFWDLAAETLPLAAPLCRAHERRTIRKNVAQIGNFG
jgi:hypothetical protein